MRYHGTDIDGVFIDPDRLEIRGVDLCDIIAGWSYPETLAHLFLDDRSKAGAVEARLVAAFDVIDPDSFALARTVRKGGGSLSQAVCAGLMVPVPPPPPADDDLPDDVGESLALLARLPALVMAAETDGIDIAPAESGDGYIDRLARLILPAVAIGAPERAGLERVFVAWTAGFGYLPPSVMIPRIAIGTGVPLRQAIGAAFAAGGPHHIGACQEALTLFASIRSGEPDEVATALAALKAAERRVPGFGHPLFLADPRAPVLRDVAEKAGLADRPAIRLYDEFVTALARDASLQPNIDAISAAIFLAIGLRDGETAANLALSARAAGMLAHCLERRRRPAFGVTSKTARAYLDTLPKDWL